MHRQTHKSASIKTAKALSSVSLLILVFGFTSFGWYCHVQKKKTPIKQAQVFCGTVGPPQSEVYKLYKFHCAMCHKMDIDLVGPKLNALDQRDSDWLKTFITNEAELIAQKDSLALYLNDKHPAVFEHAFGGILDSLEYTALKNYLITEWKE